MARFGRATPRAPILLPDTGAVGLALFTQLQTDISGGPPGNNTTETFVRWVDPATGNGWQIGMNGAYGGALVEDFQEVDGTTAPVAQVSHATSAPDGFIHVLAQSTGAVFTGTEDPTYTLTALAPTASIASLRFDSGTMSPSTGPALNYRVRTDIQPGDPGFLFHRIDITNPSASAVSLAGSDSLEIAMIGGLTQALQSGVNAWQPANGKYANVGGAETAWPSTLTSTDPDYIYITPQSGSGLSLAPFSIRKTGLAQAIGAGFTSAQIEYLQNASRLKMKLQGSFSSFPGSTTYTLYYLQGIRRSVAAGEINSIAADYLNPESSSVVSVGTANSPFYSYDEGMYSVAASTNQAALTFALGAPATIKWLPCQKLTGYTSTALPTVTLGGSTLKQNTDYLAYVDTTNQIAYVKLLKQVVASGASAGQLNNGLLSIQAPVVSTAATIFSELVVVATPSETANTAATISGVAQDTGALSLLSSFASTATSVCTVTSALSVTAQTGATVQGVSQASSAAALLAGTGATATGNSQMSGAATLLAGTSSTIAAPLALVAAPGMIAGTGASGQGVLSVLSALSLQSASQFACTITGLSTMTSSLSATMQTGSTVQGASQASSAASLVAGTGATIAGNSSASSASSLLAGTGATVALPLAVTAAQGMIAQTGASHQGVLNVQSALTAQSAGSFACTMAGLSMVTSALSALMQTGATAQGNLNTTSAGSETVQTGNTSQGVLNVSSALNQQASGAFACSILGVSLVTCALSAQMGTGATIQGNGQASSAIGLLLPLALTISGTSSVSGGLSQLAGTSAASQGMSTVTSGVTSTMQTSTQMALLLLVASALNTSLPTNPGAAMASLSLLMVATAVPVQET